jgi:Family of unknown function (DUF6874)
MTPGDRNTEALLFKAIADRAEKLGQKFGRPMMRSAIILDLVIAHRQCPLDLLKLLDADDGNFSHDVFGIMRHLDRETGELRDCFIPRFARFQHEPDGD